MMFLTHSRNDAIGYKPSRYKSFVRGGAGSSNNSKGYFDKNMPSAFKRKKHKARAKRKKTQRASRKINHLKIKISKR
jgi:hypothetical protein